MDDATQLRTGIAALEAQRAALGDAVVDLALAPLQARLAHIESAPESAPESDGKGADAPAHDQVLRQVSILFLDVVGSTRAGQGLGPEDLHLLLDGALQRFTAVVQAHGGRVLQYAGDSLLAVWGAHGVREDDAERAVQAALALTDLGRAAPEAFVQGGLAVRLGVHTGEVLLGGGVAARGGIHGLPVHVAARMEQTAPVGRVRISHDTWLLTHDAFEVDAQPPLEVKGVGEPMRTYLVERARPLSQRRAAPGAPAGLHVGRTAELAALHQAAAAAAGSRQAVTVLAEAGLGKSRLARAFAQALAAAGHRGPVLHACAWPASAAQPFALLRDLLATWLQFAYDDPAEQVQQCLRKGLRPYFVDDAAPASAERAAWLLGRLIGLDPGVAPSAWGLEGDARALRDQAFEAATTLLGRLGRPSGAPAVLLLEDLHWADEGSLELVARWLSAEVSADSVGLLLVVLARPALLERRPGWFDGAAAACHHRIDLQPLDAAGSEGLARALLARSAPASDDLVSDELVALVVERAEGNPFYLQELARMVAESAEGVAAAVRSAAQASFARIPATLNGVLQARLDALAPPQRQALQLAAVIGPVFWDAALAQMRADAPEQLPALVAQGLVEPCAGSAFDGAAEYRFHHALMHQAVYATVLRAPRQAAHAGVAAWLRERLGPRSGEMLSVVAEHEAQAGHAERALELFEQAGRHAQARHACATAIAHVERALEFAPEADHRDTRWRLLRMLVALADQMGSRDQQQHWIDARAALADAKDDNAWRAEVMLDRSLLADRLGEVETAFARSEALAEFAAHHGLAREAAMGLANCAWQCCVRGDVSGARAYMARALPWGRRQPNRTSLAQLLMVAASIEERAGQWGAQRALMDEVQAIAAESADDVRLQELMHDRLCTLHTGLGNTAQALVHAQAARELIEAGGIRHHLETAFLALADCWLAHGDPREAERHIDHAFELLDAGPPQHHARAAGMMLRGRVWCELGRHTHAGRELAALHERLRCEGPADLRLECLAQMANNHLGAGDLPAALACVDEVLAAPEEAFVYRQGPAVLWQCQRVLQAAGDARATAVQALARRALLGQFAGLGDDARQAALARPLYREMLGG